MHSLNVSYLSWYIAQKFGWDASVAARAGLLHDFCVYDFRDKLPKGQIQAFYHPRVAAKTSEEYFALHEKERQAILAKVDRAVNEPALIEELADFVHRQGGIEAAAAVMNAYLDRARSIIRTYDESEYRRSLEMLCDYIGARNY